MNRNRLAVVVAGCALVGLAAGLGALEPEYRETRNLIAFVTRAATLFEEKGPAACEDFKRQGGPWRQGEIYVFVLDMEGNSVCHPSRPSLEGQSLLELRDPDGKPIVKLFLRALSGSAPDGWVHYLWPRPGEEILTWKSSYLRRVRSPHGEGDYIVGSGLYQMQIERFFVVDRVEEAAGLLASQGRDAFATLRDKAGGFIFLDAYVFVMSEDGIELVNPAFPDLEGRNVLDVRDQAGVYPAREMLSVLADQESGWVDYYWPRPNEERPSRKQAYVRKVTVGDEVLVVGAGVYYD